MADLSGPRVPGWTAPGTHPVGSSSSQPLNLAAGTRVEVRVIEVLADRGVRLRIDTPGGRPGAGNTPTPVVTAQLAGGLPDALVNRSAAAMRSQPMMAEVTRTEPRLEVRLTPLAADRAVPRPGANPAMNPAQQWLGQELRQQLPAARPLGPALQSLLPSAPGLRTDAATVATPAPPAVHRILETLPGPGQLAQPDSLRQHIQQSGLWMEAMLGQAARGTATSPQLGADLKAQLLRAADQMRHLSQPARPANPTPSPPPPGTPPAQTLSLPAITGLLEGLLKRVTSLQLQSLQSFASDEPGNNRWFFELPLRGEQGIHGILGEIRQGGGSDQEDEAPWSIVLTLDLAELGPTRIAVASREGQVNVHFTASEPDTVARLREQMPELRERLNRREVAVSGLSVREGNVDTDPRPAAASRMLDEQA